MGDQDGSLCIETLAAWDHEPRSDFSSQSTCRGAKARLQTVCLQYRSRQTQTCTFCLHKQAICSLRSLHLLPMQPVPGLATFTSFDVYLMLFINYYRLLPIHTAAEHGPHDEHGQRQISVYEEQARSHILANLLSVKGNAYACFESSCSH